MKGFITGDTNMRLLSLQQKQMGYMRVTNICKPERVVSSRLVKERDGRRSVNFGKILCTLSSGYSSHSRCQS